MEFERAKLDIDGQIAILKLNHPEVMNAVSPEMVGGLMKALDEVDRRRDEVRCVIITGEGRGFCEWGLVNRVFADDELMEKAREMGRELAAGPTIALGLIRRLYWESPDNTYEEQLNLERQMQRKAGASADFKEGVRAFLQKRPANFKGA
jgi:enoyl-CoA hydratase/carnithine racemase